MVKRLLYFLFFLVLVDYGVSFNCTESRCGGNGPEIRFPFRIKGRQPDRCGYPGFDLSCTDGNDTVLELPSSVKLYIHSIDYKSQFINTSDPKNCLLSQSLNFSSASNFQIEGKYRNDYTLFNCSRRANCAYGELISCLSNLDYQVCAFHSQNSISHVAFLSCTKLYNIFSVSYQILSQESYNLPLSWSNPNCGSCEAKGGRCGLRENSTALEIECDGNSSKGVSSMLLTAGIILGVILVVPAITVLYRVYSFNKTETEYQARVEKFLDDYRAFNPTRYSYADLKKITDQFKDELGQGAYGTVFKGKLTNEILVAVKLLNNSTRNGEEFVNEVGTMAKIHHVNVVRLVGFCADGFRRALVYEYLPNDSLQKFVSSADSKSHFLGWDRLQHIALGVAKGIEYLHQGCDQRILHFDIKPHNILLDIDFNPKVADFGLAKLCSKDKSAISMTTARGTIGYIAPEVFSRNFGNVSYKSDVYSFGMLVLEMVGGRKNVNGKDENFEEIYFPEWIYNLLEEGEDLRFHIEAEEDAKIAKKLAIVGLWCIQWNPVDRPSMKFVVQMLEGEGDNLAKPPNPFSSSSVPNTKSAGIPGRRQRQELAAILEIE